MRKENMITRTITSTTYTVMTVNTTTATVENKEISISGKRLDSISALKKVAKIINGDSVKAVSIIEAIESTNLYGMSETDFMKYGAVIKEGGR